MSMRFESKNLLAKYVEGINQYAPLADWFNKNSFCISYFGLFNPHIGSYLPDSANFDNLIIEKMVNIALFWLDSEEYTPYERAVYAALAINKIYEENKEKISSKSRESFSISVPQNIVLPEDIDLLMPPTLVEFEIMECEAKRKWYLRKAKETEQKIEKLKSLKRKKI